MSHTSFRVNPHSIVCLNVKELLVQRRHHIWSLSDSNDIRTHNHLVCKQTLNHLAKLVKWLSCVVSTYLYGAFECMLLSCHVQVSEWIHTIVCLNVKELLAWSRGYIWSLSDSNEIWTHNHLVRKWTLNQLAKLVKDWAVLWVLICIVHLSVCYYHVMYECQSESILYSLPECQEALYSNMCHIWSLSDINEIQTHNYLDLELTLNHLAKLAKWLSCLVTTYLYSAFECSFKN